MSRTRIIKTLLKMGVEAVNGKYLEECYTYELIEVFRRVAQVNQSPDPRAL